MKTVDLSHTITPGMPLYPGTEPPEFTTPATIEKDGYRETKYTFTSHIGTHIDAPAHIIPGAETLDRLSIEQFTGPGCVIDLTGIPGTAIEPSHLKPHEALVENSEFVLLYSGWSRYWGNPRYFKNYPVLTDHAALWLAGFPLKGVGGDMISVDGPGPGDLPVHNILLGRGILLIENLAHLERLPRDGFVFYCFPLKLAEADASPVRAAAVLQERSSVL